MGHWGVGAHRMSGHYDSIACCAELRSKAWIAANFRAGWQMVSKGMVPEPERVSRAAAAAQAQGGPAFASECIAAGTPEAIGGSADESGGAKEFTSHFRRTRKSNGRARKKRMKLAKVQRAGSSSDQRSIAVAYLQVVNESKNVLHMHSGGAGMLSLCGLFRCGSPVKPQADALGRVAKFIGKGQEVQPEASGYGLCPRCLGPKALQKYGIVIDDDVESGSPVDAESCRSVATASTSQMVNVEVAPEWDGPRIQALDSSEESSSTEDSSGTP